VLTGLHRARRYAHHGRDAGPAGSSCRLRWRPGLQPRPLRSFLDSNHEDPHRRRWLRAGTRRRTPRPATAAIRSASQLRAGALSTIARSSATLSRGENCRTPGAGQPAPCSAATSASICTCVGRPVITWPTGLNTPNDVGKVSASAACISAAPPVAPVSAGAAEGPGWALDAS